MRESDFVLMQPEVVRDVTAENEALREHVRALRATLIEVSMKVQNVLFLFDLNGACQHELKVIQGLADEASRV